MKTVFFLLFIITVAISCNETKEKKTEVSYSALRTTNFKGDISSIKVTSYTCDSTGRMGEMEDCCITIQQYNEDGNVYKQISINKEGKTIEEETKDFYENGLVKVQTTIQNGKKMRTIKSTINEEGKYTSLIFLDSTDNLQMYMTDLIINEFAQPVSFTQYDKDSTIIMKEEAKYDENKLLSYFQTDKDGKLIARYENKYNAKDEFIESSVVEMTENGEQKMVTKYTYDEYDDKGNCTKRTQWNEHGKALGIIKMEFSYRK
jgi:hypothetical protein